METTEEDADNGGQLVPLMLFPSLARALYLRGAEGSEDGLECTDSEDSGGMIPVKLSASLARELASGRTPKGERAAYESSEDSGESILIYYNPNSPYQAEEVEPEYVKHAGLDTSVLGRLVGYSGMETDVDEDGSALLMAALDVDGWDGEAHDPLGRLVDDLIASSKLSNYACKKGARSEQSHIVQPGKKLSKHLLEYMLQLQQLYHHRSLSDNGVEPRIRHVLSDPVLARLWIEDQMDTRWTAKYRTTLAEERAVLKARRVEAGLTNDESELKAIAMERRLLDRQVFVECMNEQLTEIHDKLKQNEVEPVSEIEKLQVINEGQQAILLGEHFTTLELIDAIQDRQDSLITKLGKERERIDVRLEAMDDLLYWADAMTKRIKTRINRLEAKDVNDCNERTKIREERMNRPEACHYVADTCQDLLTIREISKVAHKCVVEVELGINGITDVSLDAHVSRKGCMLFSEIKK